MTFKKETNDVHVRSEAARRQADVQVIPHDVDWSDLPWSTLRRLHGLTDSSPGPDRLITSCFRFLMRYAGQLGTRYVNPQFTVMANGPSPAFIRKSRQAQRAWLKTLKTVLITSGCLKRQMKQRLPEIRQLEFTGVMVINGKHIHPQQWPVFETLPSAGGLVGQRFGRLTVVRRASGARWFCTCACGGHNTVRTKRLVRGRIRSCGCLKTETEARQKMRKANRA